MGITDSGASNAVSLPFGPLFSFRCSGKIDSSTSNECSNYRIPLIAKQSIELWAAKNINLECFVNHPRLWVNQMRANKNSVE